jgi:aminopeptidase 2
MGTAFIYNDWDLEEQFTVENLQQSMQLDSTDSTHPMTTVVNTKGESASIFDNISYNKGASILRWLSYYVGKNNFQEILKFHLDSQ